MRLGDLYLDRKDRDPDPEEFAKALEAYDRAEEIDPVHARAPVRAGLALRDLQHYEKSLAAYTRALSRVPADTRPEKHEAQAHEALRTLLREDLERLSDEGLGELRNVLEDYLTSGKGNAVLIQETLQILGTVSTSDSR